MTYLSTLIVIAGVYLLAAASPGPNFFIISQLSLAGRRRLGVLVALGIAVGSTTWAVLAMAGVAAVLARIGWLYTGVRIAGALYLVWFGIRLLWNASRGGVDGKLSPVPPRPAMAFRTGLFTSLTNPKSGAFWTSIFASVFPADAPLWVFGATASMIACLSAGWHVGLALVFASARLQAGYRRLRRPIDAACGALLVALGVRLATAR